MTIMMMGILENETLQSLISLSYILVRSLFLQKKHMFLYFYLSACVALCKDWCPNSVTGEGQTWTGQAWLGQLEMKKPQERTLFLLPQIILRKGQKVGGPTGNWLLWTNRLDKYIYARRSIQLRGLWTLLILCGPLIQPFGQKEIKKIPHTGDTNSLYRCE